MCRMLHLFAIRILDTRYNNGSSFSVLQLVDTCRYGVLGTYTCSTWDARSNQGVCIKLSGEFYVGTCSRNASIRRTVTV